MSNTNTSTYNADSILVLDAVQHVRMRPGMYAGDMIDPTQLLSEMIDNSVDELQNDYGSKIIISFDTKNNIYSVRDFGRGIPIGKKKLESGIEKEIVEVLFTVANSGGKFDNSVYKKSCGLHGVGDLVTNSLSKFINVRTNRDGKSVSLHCEEGKVINLEYSDQIEETGTYVEFKPDPYFFESEIIPESYIVDRCKTLKAFGYNIELYKNGELQEFSIESIYDLLPKSEVSYCRDTIKYTSDDNEDILVAIDYTSGTSYNSLGYTNMIYNRYGGTHTRLIKKAVCDVWSEFYSEINTQLAYDDCTLGLNLLVAVFISSTAFSSQTKEKLTVSNDNLTDLMEGFKSEFKQYLMDHPELRKGLLKRFEEYRISQDKLLSQKEITSIIVKNTPSSNGTIRRRQVVPGLIECTSTSREGTELILCEGQSAAGGVARARDRKIQAVLPLRGKIKNVAYMDLKDIVKFDTVKNIINAIGAGCGSDVESNLSRYEKICILTDADCISEYTSVWTLDRGWVNIKNLYEEYPGEIINSENGRQVLFDSSKYFYTWSANKSGELVPVKAGAVMKKCTKTDYVRITLDNGKTTITTLDHKIMLRSGEYVEAKNLIIGNSIMPFYVIEDDYEPLIKDNNTDNWYNEYWLSYEMFNNDSRNGYQIHHKDHNHRNNNPDNLEKLTKNDHARLHITEYNEDPERIKKLIEDHKNGVYDQSYQFIIDYNKSEKHCIDNSSSNKIYKSSSKLITSYNKSESHKNKLIESNKNKELNNYRRSIKKYKKIIFMAALLNKDVSELEVSDITSIFYSSDISKELITESKNYEYYNWYLSTYRNLINNYNSDNKLSKEKIKSMISSVKRPFDFNTKEELDRILRELSVINEDSFNEMSIKLNSYIRYSDLDYIIGEGRLSKIDSLVCWKSRRNHKVINVEIITDGDPIDFYDLITEGSENHNFPVDSGMFVHNCDGEHIAALLLCLFVNALPNLIKDGLVYVIKPPLYGYDYKGKRYYSNEMNFPEGYTNFTRYKGLGEMDDSELKETCLTPDQRTIYRVEYPENLDKFNEILGTSWGRAQLLKDLHILVDIASDDFDMDDYFNLEE